MDKPGWWLRVLATFFGWTALRAVYTLYLGDADPDYRFANEQGFGPFIWWAELLYAFLAVGGAVAIWIAQYRRHAVNLSLLALAVYASIMVFQLVQVERDPSLARAAYAESRRARGFPLADDRLDQIFSEGGRRATWVVGALMVLGPLAILLWRRRELDAPEPMAEEVE